MLPLPMAAGRLQAKLMAFLPGEPLMSTDNLDSMRVPNVVGGQLPGFAELGITPTAMAAVVPGYLGRQSGWAEQLDAGRSRAGR